MGFPPPKTLQVLNTGQVFIILKPNRQSFSFIYSQKLAAGPPWRQAGLSPAGTSIKPRKEVAQ